MNYKDEHGDQVEEGVDDNVSYIFHGRILPDSCKAVLICPFYSIQETAIYFLVIKIDSIRFFIAKAFPQSKMNAVIGDMNISHHYELCLNYISFIMLLL